MARVAHAQDVCRCVRDKEGDLEILMGMQEDAEYCLTHAMYGSLPKQGDTNIDPQILQSFLWEPPEGHP